MLLLLFANLMGLDPTLLADAYETLKEGSEIGSGAAAKAGATGSGGRKTKKNYLNKELIYDDETAFLYKRGDTKSGIYYLRIFGSEKQKTLC